MNRNGDTVITQIPDLRRVMDGLRHHTTNIRETSGDYTDACTGCPYYDDVDFCIDRLMYDALLIMEEYETEFDPRSDFVPELDENLWLCGKCGTYIDPEYENRCHICGAKISKPPAEF